MPQNVVKADLARRKALKSLRAQLLRDRKANISDEKTLYAFAYRTGYPMKTVQEFYEILTKSGTLVPSRTEPILPAETKTE